MGDAMDTIEIRKLLIERYPELAGILPGCAIACNGGALLPPPQTRSHFARLTTPADAPRCLAEYVTGPHALAEGDEVAVLPPVSGG